MLVVIPLHQITSAMTLFFIPSLVTSNSTYYRHLLKWVTIFYVFVSFCMYISSVFHVLYYVNMQMQYSLTFTAVNFSVEKLYGFLISAQNKNCGYA